MTAACAVNPATGKKEISLMSEAQEIRRAGADAQVKQEMGVYNDPELQRYVIERRHAAGAQFRAPNLPWHFTVVDEPAVNAFALPGGYIYITRGILPFLNDEEQLAGVLGHEIGHVTARHAAQQYTKATGAGVGLTLLSIFVPEARPFRALAENRARAALPEVRPRRRAAGRSARRRTIPRSSGWDPRRCRRHADDTAAARRGERSRPRRAQLALDPPAPADRVQQVTKYIQENPIAVGTQRHPAHRIRLQRVRRRHHLRRQSRATASSAETSSSIRSCASRSRSRRDGTFGTARPQVLAKAPDRDNYMLLQLVPGARG